MTKFMVINLGTAEIKLPFNTLEDAEKFVEDIGIPEIEQDDLDEDDFSISIDLSESPRTLIMPCNEMEVPDDIEDATEMFKLDDHPELILYPNTDKSSSFDFVADYFEDTLNDDFISTQDTPVNYVMGF